MEDNTKTFQDVHKSDVTKESRIVQLIVFTLGDEEFGANIDQVREIIRTGPITPIPESPAFIKGVTNVRGEITVAIDLKERFSFPKYKDSEEKHIIITEQENSLFGLIVDEVTEVLRIPEEEIKKAPEALKKEDKIQVSSVITLEDRLIIMLDLAKVLSVKEFSNLAEVTEAFKKKQRKKDIVPPDKASETGAGITSDGKGATARPLSAGQAGDDQESADSVNEKHSDKKTKGEQKGKK